MAFTARSGSWISYEELATAFRRLGGDNPVADADVIQMLIVALNAAYDEIVECLRNRGYTIAQMGTWGRRKEVQLYLAIYYAGRDPTVYGGSEYFDPVLKSYKEQWETICAGGPIYEEDGDLIDPDEGSGGAAQYQLGKQDWNGTQGSQHGFVFDCDPGTEHGNEAAGPGTSSPFRRSC